MQQTDTKYYTQDAEEDEQLTDLLETETGPDEDNEEETEDETENEVETE